MDRSAYYAVQEKFTNSPQGRKLLEKITQENHTHGADLPDFLNMNTEKLDRVVEKISRRISAYENSGVMESIGRLTEAFDGHTTSLRLLIDLLLEDRMERLESITSGLSDLEQKYRNRILELKTDFHEKFCEEEQALNNAFYDSHTRIKSNLRLLYQSLEGFGFIAFWEEHVNCVRRLNKKLCQLNWTEANLSPKEVKLTASRIAFSLNVLKDQAAEIISMYNDLEMRPPDF